MVKFPDFSLTGKWSPIFPGFPVPVGIMIAVGLEVDESNPMLEVGNVWFNLSLK